MNPWWKRRLFLVVWLVPFVLILTEYQQMMRRDDVIRLLQLQKRKAGREITDALERMRQLDRLDEAAGIEKVALRLEETALTLGTAPGKKEPAAAEVCPEKYLGHDDYPYQYSSFVTEPCGYGQDIGLLVTILVNLVGEEWAQEKLERLEEGLRKAYPSVLMVVAVDRENMLKLGGGVAVEIVQTSQLNPWAELVRRASTKYVLLGFDLDYVSEWMNLHRSVRLMGGSVVGGVGGAVGGAGGLVGGVGGAVRNSSGHWRAGCRQLAMRYYRLEVREGYRFSHEDCMVCDGAGGPVLLPREPLDQLHTQLPEDLMMLDWALRMKKLWLSCPDILYQTKSSVGKVGGGASREAWQLLARQWGLQATVVDRRPRMDQEFSCEEVGLECRARTQTASFLAPWCCHSAFRHILAILEQLGMDYELYAGTALGAVKAGNFLPWDIDMDIKFSSHEFNAYKDGGPAHAAFIKGEVSLYGYKKDCYYEKDAGYLMMNYLGLEVEMLGDKSNLSMGYYQHHMKSAPTRIQVGADLWARTCANPGLYARGRYGPGYLYHVQSWRNIPGMGNSHDSYTAAAWQPCTRPNHHECLSNYPIQGNMDILPDIYN